MAQDIRQLLREMRVRSGLTQEQLGAAVGRKDSTISNVELLRTHTTTEVCNAWAAACDYRWAAVAPELDDEIEEWQAALVALDPGVRDDLRLLRLWLPRLSEGERGALLERARTLLEEHARREEADNPYRTPLGAYDRKQ